MSDLLLQLPDHALEEIASRAAEIVLERLERPEEPSPYLTVSEAADYLRTSRQAVDDLLRRGKLTRHKRGDGRNGRVLVLRHEVEGQVRTPQQQEEP
ncbi:MAG: helix-turn-helix domain-containing protein [Actinobacteria bacterium]|nr:helix-turn-helix domain-containing protein [Actinomycetota bacterium]